MALRRSLADTSDMHASPAWKLFTAPDTCALAVHIALLEAGADFELVWLDLASSQQRAADYLAINPKARVPALVTPQGVLTEVPALLAFIAQSFPAAGLAPSDDPFQLARFHEVNSFLASTVHIAHAHRRRGTRWTDDPAALEALRAYVPTSMAHCAAQMEALLEGRHFVLGDRYSATDGYLFTIAGWLEGDGVDTAPYRALRAHRARVAERPATRAALAGATRPSA